MKMLNWFFVPRLNMEKIAALWASIDVLCEAIEVDKGVSSATSQTAAGIRRKLARELEK